MLDPVCIYNGGVMEVVKGMGIRMRDVWWVGVDGGVWGR